MPRIDLRFRIAAVLATALILVVGGLCIAFYLFSEELQESLEEQLVTDEIASLIRRAERGLETPSRGPHLEYYVVYSSEEAELLLPPALRDLGPGRHQLGSGASEKRVAVQDRDGARYIVVYNSGPHETQQAKLRNLIVIALATAVVLALGLSYLLAEVLTRQLRELAARVSTLAPQRLQTPLERPHYDREVAALARALDDYHARIVEMIEREQEFAANTSHELRTPLTAIKTSCELLAADPALPPRVQARVESIERAVEQMTEYIRALLLLARQHNPAAPQKVALKRCVYDAAAGCRDELAQKGIAFEVDIPEDEVVDADANALQLVLSNLIKNACRYTERGRIRVTYDAPRLSVADTGPGIAEHHLPRLFERYYRAGRTDEGLGLGLAIVERVCDHFGWKVEVQSTPGEGSVFTLVLA